MERRRTEKEVIEAFMDHHDFDAATRSWLQGHLSDKELLERFVALQLNLDTTPIESDSEGLDGEKESA